MTKILQIHEIGNVPEALTSKQANTTCGDVVTDRSLISLRQQSRDSLVRIIKYQLDRYLRHANTDFDTDKMDYDLEAKEGPE